MKEGNEMPDPQQKLKTQAVEALGRGFLISRLIHEEIGVSLPLWDDGIDLIAHIRNIDQGEFVARPLQLKVSSNTFVGLDGKYEKTPKLKMVFIWLGKDKDIEKSEIFVMSYSTLHSMFEKHLETPTYRDKHKFYTSRASKNQLQYMQAFKVDKKTLKDLIFDD
jgi:hypothetical protein